MRTGFRGAVVAACAVAVAGCGSNRPTPATAAEQKGTFGSTYLVTVSRPAGGTIRSADGTIDCGTAGSGHDRCGPAGVGWSQVTALEAVPDASLFFVAWTGDCGGGAPTCSLDTASSGADKWVGAVFSTEDRLGHANVPDPAQHAPLFFAFVKRTPGTPQCTRCHGATYGGQSIAPSCGGCHARAGHPDWLQDCAFCHGFPPATPRHAGVTPGDAAGCASCHPDTVLASGAIDAAKGRHMNGAMDGGCNACHGFPPPSGAHRAHFGLAGGEGQSGYGDLATLESRFPAATPATAPDRYAFGCGNCHPIDPAEHSMVAPASRVKVVLHEPGAPPDSLKARNAPGAAFDPATRTCGGVYCHSTGQELPIHRVTASWDSGSPAPGQRCTACHDDPPSYPGENSHRGHVLGWPGISHDFPGTNRPVPLRGSRHGGGLGYGSVDPLAIDPRSMAGVLDAAPMTCQTCHFDTVDPRNTTRGPDGSPVGYYYLDTGGTLSGRCTPCHADGGRAAPGNGATLPLRHVNGRRDVRFDPRTGDADGPGGRSLADLAWIPAAHGTLEVLGTAVRPRAPYWMTDEYTVQWGCERPYEWYPGLWATCPPGVTWTPNYSFDTWCANWPAECPPPSWSKSTYGLVEFGLGGAGYEPATRTCSNVACHLGSTTDPQRRPIWGHRVGNCFPCHN